MKKVFILGDGYLQCTIIKAAKRIGCYVIGCDMKKGNPGEKYLDEFYQISTTDKEKILELAQQLQIDGILTFASDVSALTVSYVAEKLGLPCNPLETVNIMTHKDLFHPFLKERGFKVPDSMLINSLEDLKMFYDRGNGNIIVKPIGSSGSKGVTHVTDRAMIEDALAEALKYSRPGDIIVAEEFIQRTGYQIAGDAFVVNGKIVFFGLADEHFDELCNPLVPIGESFPSTISDEWRMKAFDEVQRAISELGYQSGAVNLDFMFDQNGNVIIIELGPRNGGNLITDAIEKSCGVDLGEYTVKAALGEDMSDLKDVPMKNCVSSFVWHSLADGIFKELYISNELKEKIFRSDLIVKPGEMVYKYRNGSFGMGFALFTFDSVEQMNQMIDHIERYYTVIMD